jgi:hypothetical protein
VGLLAGAGEMSERPVAHDGGHERGGTPGRLPPGDDLVDPLSGLGQQ